MKDWMNYWDKLCSGLTPVIGCVWGALNYVLFPDHAFLTAFLAVWAAMLLDIATKYMALSHKGGGFRNATKTRVIDSNTLWRGTSIKLVSYLIVSILAGLSYRVTMLTQASVFMATVIYTVIFLREAQSILENLCDAGADLNWLLIWTRKKEKQILKDDDIDPGEGGPTI
jgi:phage-related holin